MQAPIVEVGERDRKLAAVHDDDQPVGVAVLQRTQQYRLHRAEHRRVRTDGNREDQHDARAHRRRPPDRPDAVTYIAQQALDRTGAARVAVRFPDLIETAERLPRGEPGVRGGQTGGARIVFGELEVCLHLVIELTVESIAADERQQTLYGGPHV